MDNLDNRFDLYGALWLFCSQYHSGQSSRGYRILSKLLKVGYSPGLGLQQGRFETSNQSKIYHYLVDNYEHII